MVQYYLNQHIRDYKMKDYAKSGAPPGIKLDCSLGVNPEPIPSAVFEEFKKITEGTLKHYPHDEDVLTEIANYYKKLDPKFSWLNKDYMYLGDGTTEILHNLNVMCLKNGSKVLGHAPQFTAYLDQVACLGAAYECYLMEQSDKYKFHPDLYIKEMDADPPYDLFIVENPNNPTGQIISLSDIRSIADRARAGNRILIVDEAYGDYMPIENSAINLVKDYNNVVVTRSFSKGFGMAGIRLGYIITSNEEITDTLAQFKKIENQFNCNAMARFLGTAFLKHASNIPNTKQVSEDKDNVIKALSGGSKLRIAATAPETPIMTLYFDTKHEFDLQTFIWNTTQLWTVSCSTYGGLDARAVRIMLPKSGQSIIDLQNMLKKVDSLLPPS
jgi:histidinol-phosphate aminotransferase